ncbi:MAG: hypothetical protein Kow002_01570 [Anaerolineales bacterium]
MKRSTWILLVIFVALTGLFFYLNRQGNAPQDDLEIETPEPVEFLFNEESGVPTGIEIADADGNVVQIMRNEAGVWMLEQPIETEADQGMAEAATSQVTALRILSTLELAPDQAGLVPPSYVVTVDFSSGERFTLQVGDLTPTQSGYYVRLGNSAEIHIVSKPGLDSLLSLLEKPPYPNPAEEPSYGN